MGLSASQGRLLLLTAKQSDLEYRAQQISQKRLVLAQQLEEISKDYEEATSNRVMDIAMYTGDKDEDGRAVRTSGNLTYKNLISGTLKDPAIAESAGIQKYSKTSDLSSYSNAAYRLTDVSGAIVVSSYEEILTRYESDEKKETTSYTPATAQNGIYTSKTITQTSTDGVINDDQKVVESKYVVAPASSALANAMAKIADAKAEYEIDEAQGLIRVSSSDGDKIYSCVDGSEITLGTSKNASGQVITAFNQSSKASLVSDVSKVPQSSTTITDTTSDIATVDNGRVSIKSGGDGRYSVYVDGVIRQRYVVDEGLVTGGSGNAADPNYLQDCLRNGKYLLQKYTAGDDHNDAVWNDMSWDATSNISDRYYTEDDAAAKAIYDRKQSEIQNADKKLELELDNVESQRTAVKTEIESVEKVINDNIDKSFKTFA